MNCTEAVDQILGRSDNIGSPTPDYAERRLRHLEYLREVVDDIFYSRDWSWKRVLGTLTVPAGQGYAVVPTNFGSLGRYGYVYRLENGVPIGDPLDERAEGDIFDLRQSAYRSDDPRLFAISGQDAATARALFQIPWNINELTFAIYYQIKVPLLDESAGLDNLKVAVPDKYHQGVVIPGMRAAARESKGDDRWAFAYQQFEKGKKRMKEEEARGKSNPGHLPGFFGR